MWVQPPSHSLVCTCVCHVLQLWRCRLWTYNIQQACTCVLCTAALTLQRTCQSHNWALTHSITFYTGLYMCVVCCSSGNAEDMFTSEGTGSRRAPSPLLQLCRQQNWRLLAPQLPGRGLRAKEPPLATLQVSVGNGGSVMSSIEAPVVLC
jgi:hypothetical protein